MHKFNRMAYLLGQMAGVVKSTAHLSFEEPVLTKQERRLERSIRALRRSNETRLHVNGRYRVGEVFTMTDGRQYRVHRDGSFRHYRPEVQAEQAGEVREAA